MWTARRQLGLASNPGDRQTELTSNTGAKMLSLTALSLAMLFQDATSDRLVSDVYEVNASRSDLTRYATACINQHATSGWIDIPTIDSSDPEAGIVVAINHLKGEGLMGRDVRTTLTLEARDGRFRIAHSNFQLFGEWALEWVPLARSGNRWTRTQERLARQNTKIATCVTSAARDDEW